MSTRHLLFWKPYGVASQFSGDPPTLRDHVAVRGVYPVGRLDKDSEGLMLLTGDGELQHRLSHPKFEHARTYWVQVEGAPSEADLEPLRRGVVIQGDRTRPAQARVLPGEQDLPPRDPPIRYRASVPATWIELTLREGKNRQVRRMTAAAGFPTLRLVRVSIGALTLAGLTPGQWRDVTAEELAQLAPPLPPRPPRREHWRDGNRGDPRGPAGRGPGPRR